MSENEESADIGTDEHADAINDDLDAEMKLACEDGTAEGAELVPWDTECRGCGKALDEGNIRMADGCPCNSPRGVNHGLVPVLTCTCDECDPEMTGSTRYSVLSEPEPGAFTSDHHGTYEP